MTQFVLHNISREKWHQLDITEQLANVGSEFNRVLPSKIQNKPQRYLPALNRMLELLILSAEDPRWSLERKREICRLKETILTQLHQTPLPLHSLKKLDTYFIHLTIATRKRKTPSPIV